jgi:SM-20-related protein
MFDLIASDLRLKGYSVQKHALSPGLVSELLHTFKTMPSAALKQAGIGRAGDQQANSEIRRDEIAWIESNGGGAAHQWLEFSAQLQQHLNRTLMLGLFSFESHFAHYAPGAFYKTHVDAFKGQANRILSVVLYLNPEWSAADGGELVLYSDQSSDAGKQDVLETIQPLGGTLAVFLSEDFPHEVLPAKRDRYSIAGWYRVNTSSRLRVDPPA